jgi:hypothetical protein
MQASRQAVAASRAGFAACTPDLPAVLAAQGPEVIPTQEEADLAFRGEVDLGEGAILHSLGKMQEGVGAAFISDYSRSFGVLRMQQSRCRQDRRGRKNHA